MKETKLGVANMHAMEFNEPPVRFRRKRRATDAFKTAVSQDTLIKRLTRTMEVINPVLAAQVIFDGEKPIVHADLQKELMRSMDGLRTAFVLRGLNAVLRTAQHMDVEQLVDSLSRPSDISSLAVAFTQANTADPEAVIDPLAEAYLRAVEHTESLRAEVGPMMPTPQVEALLRLTRPGIDKRRKAHKLLAIKEGSDWLYPAFQFSGNDVLPLLPKVLSALGDMDTWAVIDQLLARDDAFEGNSLLDLIRSGDERSVDRVLSQISGDGFA